MWRHQTWDVGYKETALLRQWEEQPQAAIHSQHRSTEDDLKILLRILSILPTIPSLINTCDWVTYTWSSLYTDQVRTATDCRVFWQSSFSIGSAPCNSYLPCGTLFLRTWEYRLSGATISHHRRITIRGVLQGLVVRWANLVYTYLRDEHWRQIYLDALAWLCQEVESHDEMRREWVS